MTSGPAGERCWEMATGYANTIVRREKEEFVDFSVKQLTLPIGGIEPLMVVWALETDSAQWGWSADAGGRGRRGSQPAVRSDERIQCCVAVLIFDCAPK